jgi:hypothetical protein
MSVFTVGLDEVVAVVWKDMLSNYDTCIIVDADIHFRQGMVGQGKTNFAYLLSLKLNPTFWPPRDVVIKDDFHKFFQLLHRQYPYGIHFWDEMGAFFNKQTWDKPYVKTSVYDFIQNRKQHKIWIGCVPSFWWNVEMFRLHRPNWRFRLRNHVECEVFEHDGHHDEDEDKWGRYICTVENVPSVAEIFPGLWSQYEAMNDAHPRIHLPEYGCVEGMMGLPAERVWPIVMAYWEELRTGVLPSFSIGKKPRKGKKRSKPREEPAIKAIPREPVATRETYPLLMNVPRDQR